MKKKKIKGKKILADFLKILATICILYNVCYFINVTITKKEYFSIWGMDFINVSTENMKPDLKRNDIIFVKNDKKEYEKDDIIVYEESNQIKISQVIERTLENEKNFYLVKTNNTYYPEKIRQTQIIGRVMKRIPILGFCTKILQSKFVSIIVFITLICIFFVNRYKYLKSLERRRKKRQKNNYWDE